MPRAPKAKKQRYPIHKRGQLAGYHEFEDGSITIAPMYAEMIESAMIEEAATHALLRAVTKECQLIMVEVQKKKDRFWRSLDEDYGLHLDKYVYTYEKETRRVSRQLKTEVDKDEDL